MSSRKSIARRTARRIGVEEAANFDQRREIILREAARAFNEKGVQNTSIDDIAKRLGVTKPALYHYVSSKDGLILECLQTAMEECDKLLDSANAKGGSGADRLCLLMTLWMKFAVSDFGRAMVLIDPHALSDESRFKHLQLHRAILSRIERIIRDGIEDGSIRECNTAVMALSLLGMFNSPARWFRAKGRLSPDEAIAEMVSVIRRGVTVQ